jgi:hypothetical protein
MDEMGVDAARNLSFITVSYDCIFFQSLSLQGQGKFVSAGLNRTPTKIEQNRHKSARNSTKFIIFRAFLTLYFQAIIV